MDSSPHYMHFLNWLGAFLLLVVTVYLFIRLLLRSDRNKSPKRQKGGSGNRAQRRSERRLYRRKR